MKLVRPFDIAHKDSLGEESKGYKPIYEAPRINNRFIPKVVPHVMRNKSPGKKEKSMIENNFTRGLMPEF